MLGVGGLWNRHFLKNFYLLGLGNRAAAGDRGLVLNLLLQGLQLRLQRLYLFIKCLLLSLSRYLGLNLTGLRRLRQTDAGHN